MRAWGRRFWDSPTVRGFTGRFPPIPKSDRSSGLDARRADRTGRPRPITRSPQPTLDDAKAAEFKHPSLVWPSRYVEMVEENRIRPPSDVVSDLSEGSARDETDHPLSVIAEESASDFPGEHDNDVSVSDTPEWRAGAFDRGGNLLAAVHETRDDSSIIDAGDVLFSTLDDANIFPDFAAEYAGPIPGDGYAHIGELSSDGSSIGGDITSGAPVGGDVTLDQRLAELAERGISLNDLPHGEPKRLTDHITRQVDELKRFAVRDEVAGTEISDQNDIASPLPQYPTGDYLTAAPIPIDDFERYARDQELAREQLQQNPRWEAFARRKEFADQDYNPNPSPPPYDPTSGATDLNDLLARRDEIRRALEGGLTFQEGLAQQRDDGTAGDVVGDIPEERASDSVSLSSDRDAESRDARRTAIQRDLERQHSGTGQNLGNDSDYSRD
jgi:hypothetical protein